MNTALTPLAHEARRLIRDDGPQRRDVLAVRLRGDKFGADDQVADDLELAFVKGSLDIADDGRYHIPPGVCLSCLERHRRHANNDCDDFKPHRRST